MSPLIESIRLENGRFFRLHYHQARMDYSISQLMQSQNPIVLADFLSTQQVPRVGLFKCRIVYDSNVRQIEFLPYAPSYPTTLKVVYDSNITYNHKFENREPIHQLFSQRQFCDDILIVKNGFVTDTSYANIIFCDGYRWVTPAAPLLRGTMRQLFIDTAEVKELPITVQDIFKFKTFKLINAMFGFDFPEQEVSRIVL